MTQIDPQYIARGEVPTGPWKATLNTTRGPVQAVVISKESWGRMQVLLPDNRELRVMRDVVTPQYKNQFTPAIAGFDAIIRWCNGRASEAEAVVRRIRRSGGDIRRESDRIIYKLPRHSANHFIEQVRRLQVQILEILAAEDKSK